MHAAFGVDFNLNVPVSALVALTVQLLCCVLGLNVQSLYL